MKWINESSYFAIHTLHLVQKKKKKIKKIVENEK